MTLLFPLGLLALVALPIIAALHLVRQRRRRLQVPTLLLWQQLKVPPEQRIRTLPWTTLLLLHLLAAAALALALTNPALRPGAASAPQHIIAIIDLSSSMGASDVKPSRFAKAQQAALELIDDLGPNDALTLIALDRHPRLLITGSAADAQQLRAAVSSLNPAGTGVDLAQALQLANSTLVADKRNRMLVLTDAAFSAPSTPLTAVAELEWRTWGTSTPNLAVVAFEARRIPNGEIAVYARITNAGMLPLARTVSLLVDGAEFSSQAVAIATDSSQEFVWRIPSGSTQAEVQIDSDDVLPADDRALLPLTIGRSVRVRLVSEQKTALERALAALPGLSVRVADTVSEQAAPVDLTVLNGVLPDPLPAGAVLIVNPPADQRLGSFDGFDSAPAQSAALASAFANVDLSSVQWQRAYPLLALTPTLQPMLENINGMPLVASGAVAGQPAVVWAFDPDASNLPAKLAFPLLTAASVDVLTTGALPATLEPGSPAPAADLLRPDGRPVGPRLDLPGLYRLPDAQGAVAVNFGDQAEAQLSPQPLPTVTVTPLDVAIPATSTTTWPLWPLLVLAGLGVLGFEWWYITQRRGLPIRRTVGGRS